MTMQRRAPRPTPQFSRSGGQRNIVPEQYFTRKRILWIGALVLIDVILLGSATLLPVEYLIPDGILIVGLILLMIWIWRSIPTDAEYDQWLANQERDLRARCLNKLGLNRNQITKEICLYSYILPESTAARPYEKVYVRQGQGGRWRYSLQTYTYFFFTKYYVEICQATINAVDASVHIEPQGMHKYDHIITARTSWFREPVKINDIPVSYRLERFYLEISHGRTIDFTPPISAEPVDKQLRVAPRFSNNINLVNNLRHSLAEHG
jgi:hypothetical protein